jgi:hypothetical protein
MLRFYPRFIAMAGFVLAAGDPAASFDRPNANAGSRRVG